MMGMQVSRYIVVASRVMVLIGDGIGRVCHLMKNLLLPPRVLKIYILLQWRYMMNTHIPTVLYSGDKAEFKVITMDYVFFFF